MLLPLLPDLNNCFESFFEHPVRRMPVSRWKIEYTPVTVSRQEIPTPEMIHRLNRIEEQGAIHKVLDTCAEALYKMGAKPHVEIEIPSDLSENGVNDVIATLAKAGWEIERSEKNLKIIKP